MLSLTSPLTGWSTRAERFNTAIIDALFKFYESHIQESLKYWSYQFKQSKDNVSSNTVGFEETIKESGGDETLIRKACEKAQEFFSDNPKVAEQLIRLANTDKLKLQEMLKKTKKHSSWIYQIRMAKSVSEGKTPNPHSWNSLIEDCQNNTAQFPGSKDLKVALENDCPADPFDDIYIKDLNTKFNQTLSAVQENIEQIASEGNKLELQFDKEIKTKQEALLSMLVTPQIES